MCSIDWTALGTWALVETTLFLVIYQVRISREQMKVKIGLDFADKFDNNAMKLARSKLAKQILAKVDHDSIQEEVINLFEDIGTFLRRNYLDEELIWATFSFYAIRWWSVCKDYILEERKRQDNDQTIFEDFENLVDVLYKVESKRRKLPRAKLEPDQDDINKFLKDEINLV
jgi:hypothetical protein